jgi:hypothetical protein
MRCGYSFIYNPKQRRVYTTELLIYFGCAAPTRSGLQLGFADIRLVRRRYAKLYRMTRPSTIESMKK